MKPGRKLLKRLQKHANLSNPIVIKYAKDAHACLTKENTIFIDDNVRDFYLNQHGSLLKNKFKIVLAHEMIHGLHFLEGQLKFVNEDYESLKKIAQQQEMLLDKHFHNLAEQHAICGIFPGEMEYICENAFHSIWGDELRYNHLGLQSSKNTVPGFEELFFVEAIGEIKARVNSDPSLLSNNFKLSESYFEHRQFSLYQMRQLIYFMDMKLSSLSMLEIIGHFFPLSKQHELREFFINSQALAAHDDLGSPIVACALVGNWEMVDKLLQRDDIKWDTQLILDKLSEAQSIFKPDPEKLAALIAKINLKPKEAIKDS